MTPSIRHSLFACTLVTCSVVHADWDYSVHTDAMTSKTISMALTRSKNSLALPSPYSGQNFGGLAIRRLAGSSSSIVLKIDKGQIICNAFNACAVSIRFDDTPPIRFPANRAADHDPSVLFIKNEARFIKHAASAKRILIALTIYHAGKNVLEFDTPRSLSWKTNN